MIQLQIFKWDNNYQQQKLNPNIEINEELIICGDRFELCGIVWHSGPSVTSGHYTSNVKVNGTWFYTDDIHVRREFKKYIPQTMVVPYILVYIKRTITCSYQYLLFQHQHPIHHIQ